MPGSSPPPNCDQRHQGNPELSSASSGAYYGSDPPARLVRSNWATLRSGCVMHLPRSTRNYAWFCLRTPPRREQTAASHLSQRVGIEVFAPQIPGRKRTGRARSCLSRQPLFPGYFFARFEYPLQFRHVISSQGVTGIVQLGPAPSVVADGVIEFLRTEIELANREAPKQRFRAGQTVKIVHGCFSHVEGRVLSSDCATERVRVLLNLLGQQIQVSVLAAELVSTESSTADYPSGLLVEAQDLAPLAC